MDDESVDFEMGCMLQPEICARPNRGDARSDSPLRCFVTPFPSGHLTDANFQYGITFIPRTYISSHWGKWFHIENHASGAPHDFQDVIALRPR